MRLLLRNDLPPDYPTISQRLEFPRPNKNRRRVSTLRRVTLMAGCYCLFRLSIDDVPADNWIILAEFQASRIVAPVLLCQIHV